jgi:DNA-binding XRE family transcriptional regulator
MAHRSRQLTLGDVLLRRRKQLGLTQAQVAARVRCRPNYIGYLESNARHPSDRVLQRLAKALDLDMQELFFLANPHMRAVVQPPPSMQGSAWERFKANRRMHTRQGITRKELAALENVAAMGPVRTQRDFLFILQVIRQALTEE